MPVAFRFNQDLDAVDIGGHDFAEEMIRMHLRRSVSWGVDSDAFSPHSRSVG